MCSSLSSPTTGPTQVQPGYQFGGDFGPTLGTSRAPEQLGGGIGISEFSPTRPFPTNVASPLTHRPQDFHFGATPTPLVNQGFNTSVPSNTATQQYQWYTPNYYGPQSAPELPRGFPYSQSLIGSMQENQFSSATDQSIVPCYGSEVGVGG